MPTLPSIYPLSQPLPAEGAAPSLATRSPGRLRRGIFLCPPNVGCSLIGHVHRTVKIPLCVNCAADGRVGAAFRMA